MMRYALRMLGFTALGLGLASGPAGAAAPTFSKDVAPIVFTKCAECHRPGSMAPMSLMTFEDARPWARAIKQKVTTREMPPWGADPSVGHFANDPSLSQAQIDTIAAWVDGGAPEGSRRDMPPAPIFTEGWSIGKPDYIFTMLKPFTVPADGTVPYLYFTIPTNLKEDIWIRGVELKPTDRRVVHHIISDLVEGAGRAPDPNPRLTRDQARREVGGGIGGLVPGRLYGLYEEGVARRIPAGSDIVLQMHYTTIGQEVTDQTQIGVVVSKEPPTKIRAGGGGQIPNTTFVIPPGDPNYEVTAQRVFDRDTYLSSVYPHMHVRGKDVTYKIVYPDGREEAILRVPKYDFNWQTSYTLAEPKMMPKGSILKVIAHYDNSRGNRFNPDPAQEVRWGDQTWEEMLIGYFGTLDASPGARRTQQQ
jgi:mono/diheme cytochrome c family protein